MGVLAGVIRDENWIGLSAFILRKVSVHHDRFSDRPSSSLAQLSDGSSLESFALHQSTHGGFLGCVSHITVSLSGFEWREHEERVAETHTRWSVTLVLPC